MHQQLERVGFSGAPRYLGVDDKGRQVVSWVDGDVPVPPYPDWAMTDPALASLGRLVRDYHDAVASFSPVARDWSTEWADPAGGAVVCHNDLFPENVVFRDGVVVALIDFDMAGPGRPLWDLAIAAEEWVPLHAPGPQSSTADTPAAVRRMGLLAGAYGLAPGHAEEWLDVVAQEKAHSTANVLAQAAAGDPVWSRHVAETGFAERMAAHEQWFAAQRPALLASIGP
jgi:thiamine kinase-like enzyme